MLFIYLLNNYIHTYHSLFISGGVAEARHRGYLSQLAERNTVDVTGGKPIAVWLQSISGGDAVNPLVAFYDIHGRNREVQFFCFVLDTTRDDYLTIDWMYEAAVAQFISRSVRFNPQRSHWSLSSSTDMEILQA
jgi:hypothetical protein